MPTVASTIFTNQKIEPAASGIKPVELAVKLGASLNLAKGTILGEKTGTNARHKITPSLGANLPTGGTFTITITASSHPVLGTVTLVSGALTPQSSAAEIQKSLDTATPGAGTWLPGNIRVTGGPIGGGAPIYIEFVGAYGGGAILSSVTTVQSSLTGGTPTMTVSLDQAGAAGSPGTFVAYNQYNTDGSQVARAILPYDVQTDGSGNITLSSTANQAGGEFGQQYKTVDVYVGGYFNTADLTGLDAKAVSDLGKIAQGTIAAGLLRVA